MILCIVTRTGRCHCECTHSNNKNETRFLLDVVAVAVIVMCIPKSATTRDNCSAKIVIENESEWENWDAPPIKVHGRRCFVLFCFYYHRGLLSFINSFPLYFSVTLDARAWSLLLRKLFQLHSTVPEATKTHSQTHTHRHRKHSMNCNTVTTVTFSMSLLLYYM